METDKLLHPSAARGFAKSTDLYHRARSDYPAKEINRLLKYLGAKPGDSVLELGAGTGKLTEKLIQGGLKVTALEPISIMREQLKTTFPHIEVVSGVAENLPFQNQTFDFVLAANAYHWFHPEKAYTELARVLKPKGGVGLIWTTWDETSQPQWFKDVRNLIQPFEDSSPRYKHKSWLKPFEEHELFKMLQFERHDLTRAVTIQHVCERMLSISYISALPEVIYLSLKRQLEECLKSYVLRGQIFKLPEEMHFYWTHCQTRT